MRLFVLDLEGQAMKPKSETPPVPGLLSEHYSGREVQGLARELESGMQLPWFLSKSDSAEQL